MELLVTTQLIASYVFVIPRCSKVQNLCRCFVIVAIAACVRDKFRWEAKVLVQKFAD